MCPRIQRCTMCKVRKRLCCPAACRAHCTAAPQLSCGAAVQFSEVSGPGIIVQVKHFRHHNVGQNTWLAFLCRVMPWHVQQSKEGWPALAMYQARISTNATNSCLPCGSASQHSKRGYTHHVICAQKAVHNSWHVQAMSSPRGRSKVLLMQRGQLAHVNRLAQPEVGQLHVPTCVQQQIIRLYIPATHVPRMQ